MCIYFFDDFFKFIGLGTISGDTHRLLLVLLPGITLGGAGCPYGMLGIGPKLAAR